MSFWISLIGYQLAWFTTVISAAHGLIWPGVVIVTLYASQQLLRSVDRKAELALVAMAVMLGLILDTLLLRMGLISYSPAWPLPTLAPVWILALWIAFSLTFTQSLRYLQTRPLMATLLGSIGGPLAYLGAASGWHVVSFSQPIWLPLLWLAIGWGLATPLLGRLARSASRAPQLLTALLACGFALTVHGADGASRPPIKPVTEVDLSRFMGDWYVIATIPTIFERSAYNAVETYRLQPYGEVATSFRFRKDSYDGPLKVIHSTGFVKARSGNALWGVQVFWPIKAQYIVAYLKEDYSQTIVARDARDYTWIMARTSSISQIDYDALVARVIAMGYPASKIRKVPQAWPEPNTPGR